MRTSAGMRVLMLLENNAYPQDGRVRREARTLVGAGHQVAVIAPAHPGQAWREVIDGVRVYRYPAPPPANGLVGYLIEYGYSMVAAFILSLFVLLTDGFDVIHAHNPPDTFVLVALWYKLLGKKFVFDHHDLAPEMYYARFGGIGNPVVYRALVWFERLTCRLADHIIAPNESYKAVEMQRSGVEASRITVVRNGPDLARVRVVEPDAELRAMGKTIIGFAGEMGIHDGVDYFLRAAKHLREDLGRDDFFCILVGTGDAWDSLRQLSKQLGQEEYVRFTGYVSDEELMRYLSAADICVDPDPKNPFNDRSTMNKMLEYMALGKPIVAFDLTEHRVSAQDAAVYAQPNDELDFARHIALLMDDPQRRRSMGASGRRRIETELAWVHQEQRLREAYCAIKGDLSLSHGQA